MKRGRVDKNDEKRYQNFEKTPKFKHSISRFIGASVFSRKLGILLTEKRAGIGFFNSEPQHVKHNTTKLKNAAIEKEIVIANFSTML